MDILFRMIKGFFFTPKLGDSLIENAKEIVLELRTFISHNCEQAPVQRSGCLCSMPVFYDLPVLWQTRSSTTVLSHGSHNNRVQALEPAYLGATSTV